MEHTDGVNSIKKAGAILDLLATQEPLSLSEVARRLQLPKSSTSRILQTLVDMELVSISDPGARDKLYTIDYRALKIANKILRRSVLRNQASPYLYSLANQTEAIANLGVLSGNIAVLIEKVILHVPFPVVHSEIGDQIPAHASSVGKVILAYRPEVWTDTFLQNYPFSAITQGTIANADDFKMELSRIREQGYAINNQELIKGVVSIAMPVFNYEGYCIAALALSKEEKLHKLPANLRDSFTEAEINLLKHHANRISFSLGFHSQEFLVNSALWHGQ
jgi:DNA-binding IclR family transcriptional regulator